MGIDSVKMKIKDGVSIEELSKWFKQQADNFPHYDVNLLALESEKRDCKYKEACQELENFIDLSLEEIIRIYVITECNLFPLEWRRAAHKTILPSELPSYLHKWQNYLQEVKQGKYINYLYELFLFERYYAPGILNWQDTINDFCNGIEASFILKNNWVKNPQLVKARTEILNQGIWEIEPVNIPIFDVNKKDQAMTLGTQQRYHKYIESVAITINQLRSWNRSIPKKWKIIYPETDTFEDYLNYTIDDDDLQYFFFWCEKLIEEKCGLYLDY